MHGISITRYAANAVTIEASWLSRKKQLCEVHHVYDKCDGKENGPKYTFRAISLIGIRFFLLFLKVWIN